METVTLQVTQGQYADVKAVRAAKRVPMVYYGKGVKNINFSADYQDFRRTYAKAGKSTIIQLADEHAKLFPVLVYEIQYHPVTDQILHVDLKAVDMNQPIQTSIPLKFIGVSVAVKDEGGILVANRNRVQVKCLPKDLVHEIEVDISPLVDFHTSLTVKDIQVPPGIQILDAPTVNIATVSAPAEEEVEAPVAAAPVPGEAPKEGAEAAAAAPAGTTPEAGKETASKAPGKEAAPKSGGKKA